MNKDLYINNTLNGKKELFSPVKEGHVGLYVCGPTVYSDVHLGNCRTFVFLSELEPLFNRNLIKGGDLDNAIVFVDKAVCQAELDRLSSIMGKDKVAVRLEGILNNLDLYFDNEPARHKLLDLMGDLGLLGKMMQAKITAIRPGHRSNAEFVKRLLIN